MSNTSSSNSTSTPTETPKKRRRKDKEKEKVTKVKQEEIVNVEEDDEDDDDDADEICAAASCSRPQGDEVGWVQCDICEKWYHLACVGLSPERAEAMDSYNCRLCLGGGGGGDSSTNSAVGTPPAASPESENIDVDGTTPTSPTPPVSIMDVDGTEPAQQQEQRPAETMRGDHGNNDTLMHPVTTIDLCSDNESANEDMPTDNSVIIDVETGNTPQVES